VLHLDPELERDRARRAFDSHLSTRQMDDGARLPAPATWWRIGLNPVPNSRSAIPAIALWVVGELPRLASQQAQPDSRRIRMRIAGLTPPTESCLSHLNSSRADSLQWDS
jgi:hypothetical protein